MYFVLPQDTFRWLALIGVIELNWTLIGVIELVISSWIPIWYILRRGIHDVVTVLFEPNIRKRTERALMSKIFFLFPLLSPIWKVYWVSIRKIWIIGVQKQRKLMLKLEKLFEWLDSMYTYKITNVLINKRRISN